MDALMMDYELTLNSILQRAETVFGGREIVSQSPDKTLHRYTYRRYGTTGPATLRRADQPRNSAR